MQHRTVLHVTHWIPTVSAATIGSMAKKRTPESAETPKQPVETESVRIEKDLARMLTIISIRRGKSVASIASPILRPDVEELYREVVAEMSGELKD